MHALNRRFARQSGQAIVLIALIIVVLLGFVGLAVDGGRIYVERRVLQVAGDSAALAAADSYLVKLDMPTAFKAGVAEYQANTGITASPTVSPSWCSSPVSPPTSVTTCSSTVTWTGDTHTLKLTYTDYRVNQMGIRFDATTTDSIGLSFMQALGAGSAVGASATSSTVIYDQTQTPAILTLGRAPCDGTSGSSLTVQGGSGLTVQVVGAIYSDGSIGVGNGATMDVAGNAFQNCGSTPIAGVSNSPYNQYSPEPPINNVYLAGSGLPWASNYTTAQSWPAANGNVEVYPGYYAADPKVTSSSCYFLDPGMYTFDGGFTDNGGLISNELRPPDEASYSSNTTRAGDPGSNDVQFWRNGMTCDGAFAVQAVTSSGSGGHPLNGGVWGVEVTSGRDDVFYPSGSTAVHYIRESAPSMCRTVNPNGSNQGFQLQVSNVPGAEWYNVYAAPGGCGDEFGYVGSFCSGQAPSSNSFGCTSQITMSNSKLNCPNLPGGWSGGNALTPGPNQNSSTCTLGYVNSPVYDSSNVTTPLNPYATSPRNSECPLNAPPTPGSPIQQGCPPPDHELCPSGVSGSSITCISTTANQPAAQNTPYSGDTADENQCSDSTGAMVTCQGYVTPGAVQFDFTNSAGSCLSEGGGGGVWVFGGKQYDFIVVYSANTTCGGASPNKINGNSATSYIGTIYMPGTSITLSGNGNNAIASQVIALTATIDGSSGVTVAYNPNYAPTPPAGRLIQ